MNRSVRACVHACLLVSGLVTSGVASAQGQGAQGQGQGQEGPVDPAAEARTQYQLGTQAFQAKKYAEAATHFESAASFRPHAVALYTAGLAWDLAGKPERAADAFSRALDVPGLDAKQSASAKDRVAALEKTLGTVVVQGPDGWKVQLDTNTEAPVPARLHGPPGPHTLAVKAAGKPPEHRDVTLEAGKVANIDLKDEPRPQTTPTPDPVPSTAAPQPAGGAGSRGGYWTTRRVIGVGVAGLGVAVLGAGAVLGINAKGAEDTFNARPSREAFDHASSLETWTNVALITGAVALVGGIVLVVLPDDDAREGRLRVGVGPNGAMLRGTF